MQGTPSQGKYPTHTGHSQKELSLRSNIQNEDLPGLRQETQSPRGSASILVGFAALRQDVSHHDTRAHGLKKRAVGESARRGGDVNSDHPHPHPRQDQRQAQLPFPAHQISSVSPSFCSRRSHFPHGFLSREETCHSTVVALHRDGRRHSFGLFNYRSKHVHFSEMYLY